MEIKQFDSVKTSLMKGINLIEASAGTGKTYAIAMLVLRFIVEKGIPIDKLLVVTFTKAATEELKERIRNRLIEAKQILEAGSTNHDITLSNWLDGLAIDEKHIKKHLNCALLDIDRAGVLTIHGFCQRVLKEHALESGQLFDSELTGNIDTIIQNCADDFWRIELYTRDVWEVAILTAEFNSPDALLQSIKAAQSAEKIYPEPADLNQQLLIIEKLIEKAAQQYDDLSCKIRLAISEGKFKTDYANHFESVSQQLKDWFGGPAINMPDLGVITRFTRNGLQQALNGGKFRSNKNQSSEERKQEFLDSIETSAFDDLLDAIEKITLSFRRKMIGYIQEHLEQHLQKLNVMSYDQLITRLADALQSKKGDLLCAELQQRFEVALIDEFQDTDKAQWQIFSTLFGCPGHFLYLIGDPKQAIYKFRGADIFTYFSAQNQAHHHFTLAENWRSHPSLVASVNRLFDRHDHVFLFDQLDYRPVAAALTDKAGLYRQEQPIAPLVLWQLPECNSKTGYWNKSQAETEIQIATANEIVHLLKGSIQLSIEDKSRNIIPSDIAILVRSNKQAREYQNCLTSAGVPAILNSTQSVFETTEAHNLYVLLLAIAHPGNQEYLRQALTIDWFGMDGQQLYQNLNDEILFDEWLNRFQVYFATWQKQDLMAMMNVLLEQESIPQNIAKIAMSERQLTNLHHLIELLQQAAIDEHLGILKTLDWLNSAITNHHQSDEQQLRLESDAEAVKIVTMHKAKGLEYPIVFCPVLWQRSDRLLKEKYLIRYHHQGSVAVDLGSENFEENRKKALSEELAEDIRLLYVAVTRAKYRCYIAWADVRTKERANYSALSYLLFAEQDQDWRQQLLNNDFNKQQIVLQSLSQQMPDEMEYRLLEVPAQLIDNYENNPDFQPLFSKQRARSLRTSWQMSSYTALTAMSQHDIPELPTDKAQEQQPPNEQQQLILPKGAHTGNAIHELLETISFTTLAAGENIDQQRDQVCLRYGLHCQQPEVINYLLQQVVLTPLSQENKSFTLANIDDRNCLKEMPFYLSVRDINVEQINEVLCNSPVVQPLAAKQLAGFLTGFIDLIFEFQGRFYVIDYKTNWLSNYQPERMTAAMLEHNYGLQYWIYSLVLHRYLQNRLSGYDYERHFGGVRYLFVRGMNKDVPMSGVYQDRPDFDTLDQLGKIL